MEAYVSILKLRNILIERQCRQGYIDFRVSASRTWKFQERGDKISPYQKDQNYGIISAEKEKGLASDTNFFSSSTHHHLLLFWHSLLHSRTV